jgi:hypothetical protein
MARSASRRDVLRKAGCTLASAGTYGVLRQQTPEKLVLSAIGSRFTFGA